MILNAYQISTLCMYIDSHLQFVSLYLAFTATLLSVENPFSITISSAEFPPELEFAVSFRTFSLKKYFEGHIFSSEFKTITRFIASISSFLLTTANSLPLRAS